MKVSVLHEKLQKAVALSSRIIQTKNALPVLSNVLLRADKNGLSVESTNLELAIKVTVGAKVEKPGSVTVPARLLLDLTNNISSEQVQLLGLNNNLTIKSPNLTSIVNGLAASEFPAIPKVSKPEKVTLSAEAFNQLASKVVVAAGLDESRPVLTGVLFDFKDKHLTMAATDSYRLTQTTLNLDQKLQRSCIFPARTILELIRILQTNNHDQVDFLIGENEAHIGLDDVVIVSQLIEGKYPDYHKIIPAKLKSTFTTDKDSLLGAIKAAAVFARESSHSLQLHIGNDKLKLESVSAQIGQNEAIVPGSTTGPKVDMAVNARYLQEAVSSLGSSQVELGFNDKLDPVVIKEKSPTSEFLHIIMPLRS